MDTKELHKDKVAWVSELFEAHGDFIRKTLQHKVNDAALEDDLFQELFLTLLSKPTPEPIYNIRGYLFYVLSRDILDNSRRLQRDQKNIKKYGEDCRNRSIIKHDPLHSERQEDIREMFKVLRDHLSERESDAVLLRYRDNYGIQEAAEKMGVKPRTVSRYLAVGLNKIRKSFKSQGKGDL